MTDETTGLPTDLLHGDGSRDIQTSTTNIGAYMWSAVAAEELGTYSPAVAGSTTRCHEKTKSCAVTGEPSDQVAPARSLNV